jgi:ferric-dicitrate binding protein FerR (iron transport regulator)
LQVSPTIPAVAIKTGRVIANVKTELVTSWKDAQWIVADEPLSSFATALERRYNLAIYFDSDELKNYKITGTFENETVEQIFLALSLAAPVNYKFDKNQVILSVNKTNRDKFKRNK